jgi:hypothetical protein
MTAEPTTPPAESSGAASTASSVDPAIAALSFDDAFAELRVRQLVSRPGGGLEAREITPDEATEA